MREPIFLLPPRDGDEPSGCTYLVGEPLGAGGRVRRCARPRQPGSVYCPRHHASCHLASGSPAERLRLRALEMIAGAVGGRCGRTDRQPPAGFLARLENLTRDFL